MKQKDYKKEVQAYIDMVRKDYPDLTRKEVFEELCLIHHQRRETNE